MLFVCEGVKAQKDLLATHYARDRVGIQFLLWRARHGCWCSREGPGQAWLGPSHMSPKLTCTYIDACYLFVCYECENLSSRV